LGLGALLGLLWLPVTLCFWLFSLLYPFINVHRCFDSAESELADSTELACALTVTEGLGVLAMLALLPAVRRWQALRYDLIGLEGFPPCFYCEETLREIVRRAEHSHQQQRNAHDRRHRVHQEQQALTHGGGEGAAAAACFNSKCSICLEELGLDQDTDADEEKGLKKGAGAGAAAQRAAAEERVVVALPLCMHAFHKECIYSWLAVNRSCPLCRMDVTQASGADDV